MKINFATSPEHDGVNFCVGKKLTKGKPEFKNRSDSDLQKKTPMHLYWKGSRMLPTVPIAYPLPPAYMIQDGWMMCHEINVNF